MIATPKMFGGNQRKDLMLMSGPSEKVLDLRPVFGLKAIVTASSASTGGSYVEMDVTADPGSKTMIHYHPDQEESYQVLEGTLEVFRDGQWNALSSGESFKVPEGITHGFRNTSDAPVRFINTHWPARSFEAHLETLDQLMRSGKVRGTNDPRSLVYMSMSAMENRPDVAVKPPQSVVRVLAFIGRRLGFTLDDNTSRN